MSEQQYYIRVRGRVQGPFDVGRLHALAKRGQFSRLHEVSNDSTTWSRASDHPELFPTSAGAVHRVVVGQRASEAAVGADGSAGPAGSAPMEPAIEWFYSRDGAQLGPVALSSLSAMLAGGQLCRDDMVWKAGLTGWLPLSQVVPTGAPPSGGAPPFVSREGGGAMTMRRRRTSAGRIVLIAALVLIPVGTIGLFAMGLGAWLLFSSRDSDASSTPTTPTIAAVGKKRTKKSLVSEEASAIATTADAREITDTFRAYVVYVETEVGSIGSGLIIANSRTLGVILTNQHVIDPNFGKGPIKGCGKIDVKIASETVKHPASLVAIHRTLDMALLAVDRNFSNDRAVRFVAHDAIKQGESVVALGNPLGVDFVTTEGIVSKVDGGRILTSCPINHGNSGGPLILKRKGLVAGINTSGIDKYMGDNVQNFNFALCTDQALPAGSWVWVEHDSAVDELIKTVGLERSNED